MAEGIIENVAKEIIENMAEDIDVAIANAEEETVEGETMMENIKEDLVRRNAISISNLGTGQINIP
jgi:nucleoid DNA-binding protein